MVGAKSRSGSREGKSLPWRIPCFIPASPAILSVGTALDKEPGRRAIFTTTGFSIEEKGQEILRGTRGTDKLYRVELGGGTAPTRTDTMLTLPSNNALSATSNPPDRNGEMMDWHQKLGHLNERSMKRLKSENLVTGLSNTHFTGTLGILWV